MIYSEASYPFPGTIPHQFQHIADWEEQERLERVRRMQRNATFRHRVKVWTGEW